MRPGDYVVARIDGTVEQIFGSTPTDYAQALMWAVSQAITYRSRFTVGYAVNAATYDPLIDVQHPQVS